MKLFLFAASLFISLFYATHTHAQDTVTGAFEGSVADKQTGRPVEGATVEIINQQTALVITKRTDVRGRFYQGLLPPGIYKIRILLEGYQTHETLQLLNIARTGEVIPVPIVLNPGTTVSTPTTQPATTTTVTEVRAEINRTDARRSQSFAEDEVSSLPLGSLLSSRTFDQLALLAAGVAPPPQTLGSVAGPGQGPGVGSAGQFSVNGLRSRSNNFTVDGSDNNDEDIGVRRQGFLTLTPQPIESIKEYQIISLLAPAQFGRSLGAQVNAVSKSGSSQTHGNFYGFLNTSHLNARESFDTTGNGQPISLQGLNFSTSTPTLRNVFICQAGGGGCFQRFVTNPAAGKDSLTLGQAGFVLGGPLLPKPRVDASGNNIDSSKSAFYFLSLEGQLLNANQEVNFFVPTVEQRGFGQRGATGLSVGDQIGFPTTPQGDALFSFFPFPNNPTGLYGRNTYTEALPASARGSIASIKVDYNVKAWGRNQSFTGRYNRTGDERTIPASGEAIYATIRPRVETNNFSFFWNSEVSRSDAARQIFNQFRASYGRTNLDFQEVRHPDLIPSAVLGNVPFLLNAPFLANFTLPTKSRVEYLAFPFRGTELGLLREGGFGSTFGGALGPIGQVNIVGYSPIGVDVYNFPQQRINNTYQMADNLSLRFGDHNVVVGTDLRRNELHSEVLRNARVRITAGSSPILNFRASDQSFFLQDFFPSTSLIAAAFASNLSVSLATRDASKIGLRYYQMNYFGQDEWRIRPNVSLSYGLRYEYNTVPREVNNSIERFYDDPILNLAPLAGFRQFIAGRKTIVDPDRNNFAPRLGLAYSRSFMKDKPTVIRAGYGLFYDQLLGIAISQSRDVFPSFINVNTSGGLGNIAGNFSPASIFNPALSLGPDALSNGVCLRFLPGGGCDPGSFEPYVVRGSLNQLNPKIPLATVIEIFGREFPGGFSFTIPDRHFPNALAQHYSLTIEQQLSSNWVASAAYVGTKGRNLLQQTTPNLGPNVISVTSPLLFEIDEDTGEPTISGVILTPGTNIRPDLSIVGGRPVPTAGTVYRYQATAVSRYDALQLQLRGRLHRTVQLQTAYVYSKAIDEVSDIFDLAGAPVLPQNSLRPDERGLASFDLPHRFTYQVSFDASFLGERFSLLKWLTSGLQVASIGQYRSGQPFTVNSLNDINFDGNYSDRLRTTAGFILNEDRRVPIMIAPGRDFVDYWPALGTDGTVGRNTFRAGDVLEFDFAISKSLYLFERQRLDLRTDCFNCINRANFGIPVRFLEAPAFGIATNTVTTARRIQFALKYIF